jgi:hypothetical protein
MAAGGNDDGSGRCILSFIWGSIPKVFFLLTDDIPYKGAKLYEVDMRNSFINGHIMRDLQSHQRLLVI